MALIQCPECGKSISEKALTCPGCGNPMNVQTPEVRTAPGSVKAPGSFFSLFFRSIYQPRATIRLILDSGGKFWIWRIIWIGSFLYIFSTTESHLNSFAKYSFLKSVLWDPPIMAVLSYLFAWLGAYFYLFLGRAIGGKGTARELFTAIIWSNPVNQVNSFFLLLASIPVWAGYLGTDPVLLPLTPSDFDPKTILQFVLHGAAYAFFLWAWAVETIMLSEVHRFSVRKGLVLVLGYFAISFVLVTLIFGTSPRTFLSDTFRF